MAFILIVDDDVHVQLALRQIVESAGHRVIEAANGEEAVALFDEFHPDLVVTDVFMPQVDGIETIRTIRQRSPEARIIAVSGGFLSGVWNHLDSAVNLGADMALHKPFKARDLLLAIAQLLNRKVPRMNIPVKLAV
jgi:CheY-like chemotaxis protein